MDATREHLLGRILLERRVMAEEDLRRIVGERDDLNRRGGRVTLGQLLVRDRRLDAAAFAAIQNEIELRGRACFACRRAYLVAPGGPAECPACGGPALLPALQAAPQQEAYSPTDYSPSGRFHPPPASGRYAAARGNGSSGRGNVFAPPGPAAAPTGSSKLIPSLIATPHGQTPPGNLGSTDPGSSAGRQGTELKTLGPYDLLQELGRGGMGVVYKAQHRQTKQIVALKVLLSGEFASPKMLARFKEEAATVQKLDHPNVVPIFEVGEIDGINFFTMKFVDGDLFQALLKGRGLSLRRGAEIVRDVALGAHHAHETGIVHRDLKPANVIVERDTGTPYIMDFGLAKDLDEDKGLSKTGVAIGTPYYMPPEQAQGKHREIDPRSDVYALGAILYEVLARKVPFNAESQTLLLRKIVEEEPVPPSQIRQGIPPDLETICLKALRKKKEERYPSAEAFAKDVERALAGKEIKAKREAAWKPYARTLAKNPKIAAIVAGCVLLALGATLWAVRSIAEADRAAQEREAARLKAEEEKKKHDEEEEKLRRRTEAEANISKAHSKRLSARLAANAASMRATLDEAAEIFGKAAKSAEKGSELEAQALYERAVCRLDMWDRTGTPAALEDLKTVAAGKWAPARARLALGFHALRVDHDLGKARPELEAGRTAGEPTDATARRDETAAALLCRSYLETMDGDDRSAIGHAHEASQQADDLGIEATAAEVYARASTIASLTPDAQEADKIVDQLVTLHRWHYFVHVDRAWIHVAIGAFPQAGESVKAALEVAPDAPDMKLVDGWARAAVGQEPSALKTAFAEVRRDQPAASSYWDALERRYTAALELWQRTPRRAQQPNGQQPPPQSSDHILWNDIQFQFPSQYEPRLDQVKNALQRDDRETAIDILKKLCEESPDTPGFAAWRARTLIEAGRGSEAKSVLDATLARNPNDAFVLSVYGMCLAQLGKIQDSRAAFEKVIAENARLRTPRLLYAHLLLSLKEYAAAQTVVKPLSEDTTDADVAEVMLEVGNQQVAAKPTSIDGRLNVAASLRRLNRLAEHEKFIDESLQLMPNNFYILGERAIGLLCMKRFEEAEQAKTKARSVATEEEARKLEQVWSQLKSQHPRSP